MIEALATNRADRGPRGGAAASGFIVQGGSRYLGVGGIGRNTPKNELMWLPRFSIAHQPDKKTVLRGGWGLFYDTTKVLNGRIDQFGYTRTTITSDFGAHWLVGHPKNGVSSLRDPFPVRTDGTRLDVPTRDAPGLMA